MENINSDSLVSQVSEVMKSTDQGNLQNPVTQKPPPSRGMKVFNIVIAVLEFATLFGTLAACFYFFKKGGDYIWMAILVVPFTGGVVFLSLAGIMAVVNGIYFLLKK